jgi:transposase
LGKVPLVAYLDYLIAAVAAKPDITMLELAAQLQTERGIGARLASLSRLLWRAGFTYKNS